MFKRKNKRIFLDYASTTPLDKRVADAMRPFETEHFANPSALYQEATVAKEAIRKARKVTTELLSITPEEIIFTGTGTESINLALRGVVRASEIKNPQIIISNSEHPATMRTCEILEGEGVEIIRVAVNEDGRVDPEKIQKALSDRTILVSVMYVNNEIGAVNSIRDISRVIREFRNNEKRTPFFHTDASQAPLFYDVSLERLGVDMMTLDGQKIYGPKGIGLLASKRHVPLDSVIYGGGQERGKRAGTENVSGIVGFAKAFEIAASEREEESSRLATLRDYAFTSIKKLFPHVIINGSLTERAPNNINVCFPGIDAEFTVIQLDEQGIAASFASSCKTLSDDSHSYVVEALGYTECASSSLRFTLGRGTTKKDIDVLCGVLQTIMVVE